MLNKRAKYFTGILAVIVLCSINTTALAGPKIKLFGNGPEIVIDENTKTDFPVIISHSEGGQVTLTCESSNINLVSHANFWLNYSNTHIYSADLTKTPGQDSFVPFQIIPIQNHYGKTTITLRIEDSNNAFDTVSFVLNVNGKPRISPIADYTISNMLHSFDINFEIDDPETAGEDLDITIISSQPDILPLDNISLTFPNQNSDAKMTLQLIQKKNGLVKITIQVSDKRLMTQESCHIQIKNVPLLYMPSQWTIPMNSNSEPIPFSICDSYGDYLTLFIQSTDMTMIRNEKISIASMSNSINLTLDENICKFLTFCLQPEENRTGNVALTFVLDNGIFVETKELMITIVNTPPQITSIPSQIINMNPPTKPVSFSVTDAEGGWITLTCYSESQMVNAFCSQQGAYTRFYLDANETRFFSEMLLPASDAIGTTEFSIHITDGFLSETTAFSLTVNSPPIIMPLDTQIINKNTISTPIALTVIDHDTPKTNLRLLIDIPCSGLFNTDDINYICTTNACTLLLTPVTNQAGTCQISVNVSDGIGENTTPIDIRVNEQPFIEYILPQKTDEDHSLQITTNAYDDDLLNTHQWSFMFSNPQLVDSYEVQTKQENQSVRLILNPTADMSGQTTVTVKMTDSNALSYSRSFLWQVEAVDDYPDISGLLSGYRIEENTSLTMTIQLFDVDTPINSLDIIIDSSNTNLLPTDHISIQSLNNNRIIRVVPVTDQTGETDIYIKIYNVNIPGSYRLYPVNLTVFPENNQPVVSSWDLSVSEDSILQYRIRGSDADQHPLRYIIEKEPKMGRLLHFDSDSGLFTYVPFENNYGVDTMRVKAFDGIENSEPAVLTITILPINDAPVASDDYYIISTNQELEIDLQAFDIDSDHIHYRLTDQEITFGELDLTDASTGHLTYSPPVDKIGQDHVWFYAKDDAGLQSNIGTITIRIENQLQTEYTLTVNMAGAYNKNDFYEYALLDATDGEEVISGRSNDVQFAEALHKGSYQMIIIATGYEPYEYSINTNRIITIDDHTEITCQLKKNENFNPYAPSVQVSKTHISNGFILRVKKMNFDDQFVMKINDQTINTGEESWPYRYKWTVRSSPFSVSSSEQHYNVDSYIINFKFYNWKEYVDTYSVEYYDNLETDESMDFYLSEDRKAFEKDFGSGGAYGQKALYETEGYSYFYPLVGNTINLRIQSGTGAYTETQISIPKIPLNYLIIADDKNWTYNNKSDYFDVKPEKGLCIKPSDRLKVTYSHYAFFITIASGMALEFEMADGPNAGKKVRYNPFHFNKDTSEYERYSQAPVISVPIILNSNYNKFHDFSEALLSLMNTFPALVNEIGDGELLQTDNGDLVECFHREYMPFVLQDKIIVYLQANHLSRFAALWSTPVENDDVGHQYFHAESIDDGGCFIQGLLFRKTLK